MIVAVNTDLKASLLKFVDICLVYRILFCDQIPGGTKSVLFFDSNDRFNILKTVF